MVTALAPLTAHDRCDACGVQAAYIASKDGRTLLFCGHHSASHGPALLADGWSVSAGEVQK
jgi:hypothetical protein